MIQIQLRGRDKKHERGGNNLITFDAAQKSRAQCIFVCRFARTLAGSANEAFYARMDNNGIYADLLENPFFRAALFAPIPFVCSLSPALALFPLRVRNKYLANGIHHVLFAREKRCDGIKHQIILHFVRPASLDTFSRSSSSPRSAPRRSFRCMFFSFIVLLPPADELLRADG